METSKMHPRQVGRRMTQQRTQFLRQAESAQLGTVTRAQLLWLVPLLICLGMINATECLLLQTLIRTAPVESFGKSGFPVVFKSNRQLAFEICKSPSRISRLLGRLFDEGLITMRDSGNYKRYALHNGNEQITDACGIDLRILISRYDELKQRGMRARAERKAINHESRRFRGAHRNLCTALRTAAETVPWHISSRINRVNNIVRKAGKTSSRPLQRGTAIFQRLTERLMELPTRTSVAQQTANTTCLHVESDMHIQNTNQYPFKDSSKERTTADAEQANTHTNVSASNLSFEGSAVRPETELGVSRPLQQALVPLQVLLTAVPALVTYGFTPKTWPHLIRDAVGMCRVAGISDDARHQAIQQMGERWAVVAIAVTLEKYERKDVKSPEGYLRSMTKRDTVGDLHLSRSVFGLAARNPLGHIQVSERSSVDTCLEAGETVEKGVGIAVPAVDLGDHSGDPNKRVFGTELGLQPGLAFGEAPRGNQCDLVRGEDNSCRLPVLSAFSSDSSHNDGRGVGRNGGLDLAVPEELLEYPVPLAPGDDLRGNGHAVDHMRGKNQPVRRINAGIGVPFDDPPALYHRIGPGGPVQVPWLPDRRARAARSGRRRKPSRAP